MLHKHFPGSQHGLQEVHIKAVVGSHNIYYWVLNLYIRFPHYTKKALQRVFHTTQKSASEGLINK